MNLWNDIRFGVRTLTKSPGYTIAAVMTLALGIGVTTATFSCADALLWKPIPLPHMESLVMIGQRTDDPTDFNSATSADIQGQPLGGGEFYTVILAYNIYGLGEDIMADRKQFLNVTAPDPELMRLLDASRGRVVTEEELCEQRISFAFGNAPHNSELITKDSVRAASTHIRLL